MNEHLYEFLRKKYLLKKKFPNPDFESEGFLKIRISKSSENTPNVHTNHNIQNIRTIQ